LAILALFGPSVVAAGAVRASGSAGLQKTAPAIGTTWRESSLSVAGWSIVMTSVIVIVTRRLAGSSKSIILGGVTVLLAISLVVTGFLSTAVGQKSNSSTEAALNSQIAVSFVTFDSSAFGNEFRCSLLDDWAAEYHDKRLEFRPAQLRTALNTATQRTYGVKYCE
jgi:hypothetical protein